MIAYWRRLRKNQTSCKKGQIGMEQAMPYTLDQFCTETRGLLKTEPLSNALGHIADRLGRLLSNPGFVAETFSDDMPPGAAHPAPRSRDRFLRAGARAGGQQDRKAAQPR